MTPLTDAEKACLRASASGYSMYAESQYNTARGLEKRGLVVIDVLNSPGPWGTCITTPAGLMALKIGRAP